MYSLRAARCIARAFLSRYVTHETQRYMMYRIVNLPVKIELVKLHKREHKSEPFLRVNKFGQVPALCVEHRKDKVRPERKLGDLEILIRKVSFDCFRVENVL